VQDGDRQRQDGRNVYAHRLVLNKRRYPQDKRFTDAFLSILSKIRKKPKEQGRNCVLIPLSVRV